MSGRTMGIHHTGITVRNIERSLAWWKEMFDVEPDTIIATGEPLPEAIQTSIGVPGAALTYAFIKIGDGMVELLEYHDPIGRDFDRSNSDVGAAHVCIRVADVVAQYEHMVAKGAKFRHPPIVLDGELEGNAFAYAQDPDGLSVEIWQEP